MKNFDEKVLDNVTKVSSQGTLPDAHRDYLHDIKNLYGFTPKTVYDIGSCVLHWTVEAKKTWPGSEIILFDATDIFEPLYIEKNYKYHIGVLSNETGKTVSFFQNNKYFAGNSYYRENPLYNYHAKFLFDDSKIVKLQTETLDLVVSNNKFNLPDLIKIDVQGAELDVLMGATEVIKSCRHLIIELRNVEYNIGSPEKEIIIEYLKSIGFENQGMFCDNGLDADYHFIRKD
jgi:FkbM family methyltransferase